MLKHVLKHLAAALTAAAVVAAAEAPDVASLAAPPDDEDEDVAASAGVAAAAMTPVVGRGVHAAPPPREAVARTLGGSLAGVEARALVDAHLRGLGQAGAAHLRADVLASGRVAARLAAATCAAAGPWLAELCKEGGG